MAMGALAAHHHRNAEAGMFHDVVLYHIVGFRGEFRHDSGLLVLICPRVGTVQAVQNPQSAHALYFFFEFVGQGKFLSLPLIDPESVQTLIELSHFFL